MQPIDDQTQREMREAFQVLSDLSSQLYHYELSVLLRQYGIEPNRIDKAKVALATAMGRRRQANREVRDAAD